MANTMWGGRFAASPDAIMEKINASIDFDRRLYAHDIAGIHGALPPCWAKPGIMSQADAAEIRRGCDR